MSESGMSSPSVSVAQDSKDHFYRPELDWVRFLAFFYVFVAHAFPREIDAVLAMGIPDPLATIVFQFIHTGVYGVDLFFALSAFLITELLLREREIHGRVDIKFFYIRRILRIWPLYFGFLFIVGPFDVFLWQTGSIYYYIAMLFFAGNWYHLFSLNTSTLAGPLWSISVEEQFYVTWPLLLRAKTVARMTGIMVALLVVALAARFVVWSLEPGIWTAYWYNTFARLDPFACGGLLALAMHGRSLHLTTILRIAILLVAVALFTYIGSYGSLNFAGPVTFITYPLAAIASILCIFAFVAGPTVKRPMPVYFRVWSYLGKISYGLYVFHQPALVISDLLENPGFCAPEWWWVYQRVVAGTITLVLSMVSYAVLEKPFLKLKSRFAHIQSRPA